PAEIKSSFFKELENDILQNDVTQENVETAFLNYLEKLDGVARLEIKAMWYDDRKKTLHVVGRTYGGDPKLYYYRQLIENGNWTPKKISNNDDTGCIKVTQTWNSSSRKYTPDKRDFIFTPLDVPEFSFAKYLDSSGNLKDPSHFLSNVLNDIESALQSNGD